MGVVNSKRVHIKYNATCAKIARVQIYGIKND